MTKELVGSMYGVVQGTKCSKCGGNLMMEQDEYDWQSKCYSCGTVGTVVNRHTAKAYTYRGTLLIGSMMEVLNHIRK